MFQLWLDRSTACSSDALLPNAPVGVSFQLWLGDSRQIFRGQGAWQLTGLHVLERIFVRLHLTDLARCCQVSKSLQSLVQQEGVWQSLCADAFPNLSTAELSKWINPTPLSESQHPFQSPQQTTQPLSQISKGPQTYRSVVGCSFLKKSYSWLLSHRQLHIFAHAGNCTLC